MQLKDVVKLKQVAKDFDVAITEGEGEDAKPRAKEVIAQELADKVLKEFGQQEGELTFIKRAPKKRQEIWRKEGVVPRGCDIEIVELMHRTHMGVDQEYHNIIKQCTRTALADGWGGCMISTDLQDILFGTPVPVVGEINLGVLKEDHVNIIIHGHEPLLPEMLAVAVQEPEIISYAQNKGAKGINLAGMCCSANEVLMRHGIPCAGNYLQQELAIITGAVDAMVVDVQCEMQSLANVAKCYHTKLITTDKRARIEGESMHIPFDDHHALDVARQMVREAIDNFPNRRAPVLIPDAEPPHGGGFQPRDHQVPPGRLHPGQLLHPQRQHHQRPDTGRGRRGGLQQLPHHARQCPPHHDQGAAQERRHRADHGLLGHGLRQGRAPDTGSGRQVLRARAGGGLRDGGHAAGPAHGLLRGQLPDPDGGHGLVKDGGLGNDISDLPAAGAAPEWMSEKAITIGQYFVASGVYTVFGVTWPTTGQRRPDRLPVRGLEESWGACGPSRWTRSWAAKMMIAHIDKKRKALGLDKARERVLYDMDMRRQMEEAAHAADH